MRRACFILFLMLFCLSACDKAPSGVIGERKMAALLEDFFKADAYMDMHSNQFDTDSARQVMKQSIMRKHGITQAMYDSSLVWYAHNMDTYTLVFDRVLDNLESQKLKAQRDAQKAQLKPQQIRQEMAVRQDFSGSGDTIDIWTLSRLWMLPPALGQGYITFTQSPDNRYQAGDRYELSFKSVTVKSDLKLLLAVDYQDGGTAFMSRGNCPDGWNKLMLQSDSTRTVRRIYGYVRYNNQPGGIAIIDSLALLRMHKKDVSYGYIGVQRLLERNK